MDFVSALFEKKKPKKDENKEIVKEKKPSPFEYHNKFFYGKLTDEDKEKINIYLFLTHLSNEKRIIEDINLFNMIEIPNKYLLNILSLILRAKNVGYIKYPKKPKLKNEKYLNSIKWYFRVNDNTARRYLENLSKEELKEIDEAYKASS